MCLRKERLNREPKRLLGHSSVTATSSYIGVTDNSALDLARQFSF